MKVLTITHFPSILGAFAPISKKRPLSQKKNIEIRILRPKIDQKVWSRKLPLLVVTPSPSGLTLCQLILTGARSLT